MSRPLCPRCQRPVPVCLCDLVRPVPHQTEVLLLQHPEEAHQAKGSATLLHLSLARCTRVVGEHWDAEALHTLLHSNARQPVLLYPASPPTPGQPSAALFSPGVVAPHQLRLVVLDATWRKSRKLLHLHPALQALPRLGLAAPPPSLYAALRKAQADTQRSTLEATCLALTALEGPAVAAPTEALLHAFAEFVRRGAAHRPAGHSVQPG